MEEMVRRIEKFTDEAIMRRRGGRDTQVVDEKSLPRDFY
jgi:hypothetical protein